MAYTSEAAWQAILDINGDYNLTLAVGDWTVVHTNPNRSDGYFVTDEKANFISVAPSSFNINTGASDDFVWLNGGGGFLDLGGGKNYADVSLASVTYDIDDDTGITTLAGFNADAGNDRIRYRGEDAEAFGDALVDAAVEFSRGRSDDLSIEFGDTIILLEDFQGDLDRLVRSETDYEQYLEYEHLVSTYQDLDSHAASSSSSAIESVYESSLLDTFDHSLF